MATSYRMQDDSVTLPNAGAAKYAGKSVTQHAEALRQKKPEPGRRDISGDGHRGAGKASARMATSVSPLNPIDPRMPEIHPS